MKLRHRPLWQKVLCWLLVISMIDAYADVYRLTDAYAIQRQINRYNDKVLDRLDYIPARSEQDVAQARAKARAAIASSRQEYFQRQQAGLAELRSWTPRIWKVQHQANMEGLSQTLAELTETVRRVTSGRREPAGILADGRSLLFARESVRTLTRMLEREKLLPSEVFARAGKLTSLLDGLGEDPSALTVGQVTGMAAQAQNLLASFVNENAARHKPASAKRNPRHLGNDPLTGRPLVAQSRPQSRALISPYQTARPLGVTELKALYAGVKDAQVNAKLAQLGAPTSADLAETMEVKLSQKIKDLAASLGNDPVQIFNYVRREIDFKLYYGSLYGGEGALDAGLGNDVDQASLLISLLRAAGIPARYETGTAMMPGALVKQMTGFQDLGTAATALATMGYKAVLVNGSSVQLTRTWVRAYIPYTNYRGLAGTKSGGGSPQWVALDPAIKNYEIQQTLDLSKKVVFDVDQFVSASTGTSALEFYEGKLREYLQSSGTKCETLDQAVAHLVNKVDELPILPTTLPYDVPSSTVTATELSNGQRYSVNLSATDSWGFDLFDKTFYVPSLYGKRLNLTFPSGSGIYSSLSGSVKPTLSLDGTIVTQAGAVSAGTEIPLYLSITTPGLGTTYHSHEPVAGGTYAVNVWVGPVPKNILATAESAWQTAKASGSAQNVQDVLLSQVAGLTYHSRLHTDDARIYGLNGWVDFTECEAMTGTAVSTLYYFGFPTGAKAAGYFVDAENTFFSAPLRGTISSTEQARIAEISGWNSSFHEHKLWESVISTQALASTNILQYARLEGQPIYFLESISEYNSIASKLKHPSAVINDVVNALNNGEEVVISERQLVKGSKTMSGYVLFDPRTGAGKYLISSILNGGETVDLVAEINKYASWFGFAVPTSSMTNVSEGSLSDNHYEMAISAYGQTTVIQRHYYSAQKYPSELGLGWSWTFGDRLHADSTTGNITRINDRGIPIPYTKTTTGSYTSPPGNDEVMTKTSTGYTIAFPDQKQLQYDGSGRLTKTLDRYNNALILARDASGCADKLTTSNGKVLLEITCDSQGHITQITDPEGRTITITYTDGQPTTITDANGHNWTYSYGAGGRMLGKQEGDKAVVSYTYDGNGRLTSYTTPQDGQGYFAYDTFNKKSTWKRPSGGENLFGFDAEARLTERVDPVGNKTTREYTNGNLTKFTDARGGQTTFEYDTKGNMVKSTDPSGDVATVTYDSKNRVTSRKDSSGTRTLTYDDTNHIETITEVDGRTEVRQMNAQGQVVSITRDGNTGTYAYDTNDRLSTLDDGSGNKTTIAMDSAGRVTSIKRPGGETSTIGYDGRGNMTQITLPGGGKVVQTYNGRGRLESMTDPLGNKTSYTYSGDYRVSETLPDGRVTVYERDGEGRLLATVDSQGNRATRVLDSADRLVSATDFRGNTAEFNFCADVSAEPCDIIDPQGNLIQRTFDARGRVTTEKSTLGTWTYEYTDCASCGQEGKLSAKVDALGNRTEYTWDARGNVATVKDPMGGITTYTHDSAGQVTSMTDATGSTTTYSRDLQGRLEEVIDELNRLTSYTYNANGQLVAKTDPNGDTVSYTYDGLGNITAETFADGSSHAFIFDSLGRKLRATSPDADLEYQYDAIGRYSKVINHTLGESLAYTYDDTSGQVASLTRPDGTQRFAYDKFGKLTSTTLPDGQVISYRYDSLGRVSEKRFPNGNVEKTLYDGWGRLSSRVTYDRSGAAMVGATYTFDAIGRKLSSTNSQGVKTTYAYDALSRLTEEKTGTLTRTFTYDAASNRKSMLENGTVKITYTYDDTHRLTAYTENGVTTTLTYDDNGNVVKKQTGASTTTFTYDLANRLTSIQVPGKTLNQFKYDAEGRRVFRADSTGEVYILNDREDAVLEVDKNGNHIRGFAHGPGIDEPLALHDYDDTGKTWFYHTDGLGSVVGISGTSGAMANTYSYDAFGMMTVGQSTVTNDYSYTGRRADMDTGTYDFRARQLDPSTGRFLQADPRSLESFEQTRFSISSAMSAMTGLSLEMLKLMPKELNPYTYVGGNPMNLTDPSGEGSFWTWDQITGIILGIIGIILAIPVVAAIGWLGAVGIILGIIGMIVSFVALILNLSDPNVSNGAKIVQIVGWFIGYHLALAGFFLTTLWWAIWLFIIGLVLALIVYALCEYFDSQMKKP